MKRSRHRSGRRRRSRKNGGATFMEYGSAMCFVSIIVALAYQFVGHPVPASVSQPGASGLMVTIQKMFWSPVNALNNVAADAVGATAPAALP